MGPESNILEEAISLTGGNRNEDYGHPLPDARRWAAIASACTGLELKPEHYPLVMIAAKLSRQMNRHKRDNLTDIAGYARVAQLIFEGLCEEDDHADIQKRIVEAVE